MVSPSTPPRELHRLLEESPAFSVYFSDDDFTASPSLHKPTVEPTPLQRKLLGRLHDISQQILRKDVSNRARAILDAELDALERTLQAPESQSREPADVEDMDDDDSDEQDQQQQNAEMPAELRQEVDGRIAQAHAESELMEQRIAVVVRELQDRYQEVQHINDIAIARLDLSKQQVADLSAEMHKLRKDFARTTDGMLYLKMQLRALEAEARPFTNTSAGRAIREGIERWKADWEELNQHSQSLTARQDSAIDGIESADDETVSSVQSGGRDSPRSGRRSRITISREAPHVLDFSDPFVVNRQPGTNGTLPEPHKPAAATVQHSKPTVASVKREEKPAKAQNRSRADSNATKTPWEELWEGLAALTGMQVDED